VDFVARPSGGLGAVATALGEAGANIHAMELVERDGGYVVEDFLVRLSPDRLIESVVAACHKIPDVSVDWVSRYPSDGNLQSDQETLESVTKDPGHAAEILLAASPVVFRAHWALLISVSPPPTVVLGTVMAPELESQGLAQTSAPRSLMRSAAVFNKTPSAGATTKTTRSTRSAGCCVTAWNT
jgi:hypothetical protein